MFIDSILQLTKRIYSNSEQRYWNIILKNNKVLSIYYLNISLYCNGDVFFIKKHRHFFNDINGIHYILIIFYR